ncbi:MAG: histidine kinase N-terminal 7TM domain-containing protein [Anaerolineales bacterium]
MRQNILFHLIPYIFSFLISFSIGLITWQRRTVRGVKVYSLLAFSQCTISFGYIMELTSSTLQGKIFWDDFQWYGFVLWVVLFPMFAIQFTQFKRFNKPSSWLLLSIMPLIFIILLVTNSQHGLIHHQEYLIPGRPFNALTYPFTPAVWIFGIYSYVLLTLAFIRLLINFFRTGPFYRAQVGAVVFGAGIPIFATLLVLFGVRFGIQRDISPITLAIGNLFVAWGLLRYQLFDVVPVAWDVVIQTMDDLVIVLDPSLRILGLTRIAKEILEINDESTIGKSAQEVFQPWWPQLAELEDTNEGELEIEVSFQDRPRVIDIHVSPLWDQYQHLIGRVYVARDISHQKKMENELRMLNSRLEDLVFERTQELEDAYNSTLEGWAKALEIRDKETEGHSRRVTDLTVRMAQKLSVSPEKIEHIRRGALLHDIGKMAISDEILHKPAALTSEERTIMQRHPKIAEELLSHITFLENALEIPRFHHERWDGKGYPYGRKGDEIPLAARIFIYIDHWDALLSDRPYRAAWTREDTINYIVENSGTIFDPSLLNTFLSIIEKEE